MRIIIKKKTVYGNELFYPVCEDAMTVLQLGKKYHEEYVSIMKLNVSKPIWI